jgi:3-oxoacid CoA-transferase subunit B
MIRGGHLDVTVMGALEVSERGDLANFANISANHYGVGGAMDLAFGARRVIIAMAHTMRSGKSKVVRECTVPLTRPRAVSCLVTELAVFDFADDRMWLRELQNGVTLDEVRARTEARFELSPRFSSNNGT